LSRTASRDRPTIVKAVEAAAAAAHLRERQRLVVVVVVLKSAAAAAASSATAATGLVNATTFSACFSLRGGGCVCVWTNNALESFSLWPPSNQGAVVV